MTELHETLDKIKNFDCQPAIFKVFLLCSCHMTGFDAWVSFRGTSRGGRTDSVTCHGDTPEEAVNALHETLKNNFSKCPHCGEHPRKETT